MSHYLAAIAVADTIVLGIGKLNENMAIDVYLM